MFGKGFSAEQQQDYNSHANEPQQAEWKRDDAHFWLTTTAMPVLLP